MLYLLVFCSGFAGLVYEVLWMKQLGLLFGNTSHAAAVTLAAFFGGLTVGSWLWGRRAAGMKNGLRAYAWLEVGIAATAALYFPILQGYHALYPLLYQRIEAPAVILAVKFALALLVVFPPALCMGGTIPVMGQVLIREPSGFGKTGALLYGVNTLGAALGALMAGFYLPLWLGFRLTCFSAMAVTSGVAAVAFVLSRGVSASSEGPRARRARATESTQPCSPRSTSARPEPLRTRLTLHAICFLSGFGFLALEVLWTRMFMQVLENSVYTFAAILVIVLLCLAAGAFISARLARLAASPLNVLAVLMLLSGLVIALTPFVFMHVTHSLQILAMRGSWSDYVLMIFRKGFVTIGPPALLLGTVFPFLMKTEERSMRSVGRSLGRLAAVNTAGAILGSLLCGFLFLGTVGMWGTSRLLATVYLVAGLLLPIAWSRTSIALRGAAGILLLLLFVGPLDPTTLPIVSTDPLRNLNEEILETWEGSDGTVAMTRSQHGLAIKMNSHYGLGATGAFMQEKLQNDIPLMAYPGTQSIFFLGMGTGITAGSALDSQFEAVNRIVVCELSQNVITAAKKYITNVDGIDYTGGLFTDSRATILAEDGRHYLMAARERFDMVNGDLFVPFRSGVGSLYTREHFQNVKNRLEPGGVFFQWIPLYQVTEHEFAVIARTMLEVFDQVSLWRTGFQPGDDVVALAGHRDAAPLPACDLDIGADKRMAVAGKGIADLARLALPFNPQAILFFYCGNVSEARSLFADYPVNTDDRPVIEYMAPRSYRGITDSAIPWFVGPRLARMVEAIQAHCPPSRDPLLANRSAANRRLPVAGSHYYRARLWQVIGDPGECRASWLRCVREWLDQ